MSASRPHPHLRVERAGPVLQVTLDRAERRNAQVPSLWGALAAVAEGIGEPRDPEDVRVVVLAAEGPSFSAGLDRAMIAPRCLPGETDVLQACAPGPEAGRPVIAAFQRGFAAWRQCPAVVVAAVQGHAIGAGCELALAADIRIAATDAILSLPEVPLGLVPDLGATWSLVRHVGSSRAFDLVLTGRGLGAEEAFACGLLSRVVPPSELASATRQLVGAILAAPLDVVLEATRLLRQAPEADHATQLLAEQAAQARILHAHACREAGGSL